MIKDMIELDEDFYHESLYIGGKVYLDRRSLREYKGGWDIAS
jgi:hypothetical protein